VSLRYCEGVADLFRAYCDEPDVSSMLTAAHLLVFLEQGHREYRQFIVRHAPDYFATRLIITPSGRSYDLAGSGGETVTIFGTTATHPIASTIVRLYPSDSTTRTGIPLEPCRSIQQLETGMGQVCRIGTWLHFDSQYRSVVVEYVPIQDGVGGVDWSKLAPLDNEWIDNLIEFHDVIALMAYRHYAIRDAADNRQLERSLGERKQALADHLRHNLTDASRTIIREA
jgi:hypothetical protein